MKSFVLHIIFVLSPAMRRCLPVIILSILAAQATAQQSGGSPDELFRQARLAAFERKDYDAATDLCKKALELSPGYNEIRIFLGRVYTWSGQPDSARREFTAVLERDPGNEEASIAYGNLEYWNHQHDKALAVVDGGLERTPGSAGLLLLKSKILNDERRFREAGQAVEKALESDPRNAAARALATRIRDNSAANAVGFGYEFTHFDKQFPEPWHLVSLGYSRQTGLGPVSARVNYARRFADDGLQFELEGYPRISRTFYAYVGGGYSGEARIFPKYRAGFSLFANLPRSFEAEAGFRLLHFAENTFVYTLSAGKYYRNYWFNFRTYLAPAGKEISRSYALTARYYYGGPDDFVSLSAGTGISPDDNSRNILLSGDYELKANTISVGFRRAIGRDVLLLGTSWQHQEFSRNTWGNQFSLNVGFQKRF